ncbi:MAG: DEAD/DEAH box helicase family protein [Bacteroidetes bacterium]|nr:DEAD/DEAH box helicase family protein [Bacteroidota bacterium]
MRLKNYQEKVLHELQIYLDAVSTFRMKYDKAVKDDPDIARDYDFPRRAWEQATGRQIYYSKTNGLGQPVPDLYFKVPTGGGKTVLACHAIDQIHKSYLKKQCGLVLWIVPTTQIYRQTIAALKNREHPYRQVLDISSGGRILIKEKTEHFNRLDVEENLMVLMLMLPSANRQNKETLKIFQDAGGFTDFFPPEDNFPAQLALLKSVKNLHCFSIEGEIFTTQIKTSLGNTLRLLNPLVIIDEGHKAYSEGARNTIRNFNPSFILELSATPPAVSNKLVEITGRELNEEEMIKLDIHLINKTSLDWKDTMLASLEKRDELERKSKEYEQNTGEYIRPICLIQVERTGRDQIGTEFIHSEDVKAYLIKQCNVPEENIAIKSSEKDDIEGLDLFARECGIRYIITKQALQEGWDCAFAYVLTILTNPSSATGITQLIGRILRQPSARKTKIAELDESYVFTFRQSAAQLVREIKAGLEGEGLGDVAGRIVHDEGDSAEGTIKERETSFRAGFKKFEGKIYLPKFVVQENNTWRDLNFEMDILQYIDWEKINIEEIKNISLTETREKEQELILGLSDITSELIKEKDRQERTGTLEIDKAFMARQLSEIVPNPWIAWQIGHDALNLLSDQFDSDKISTNFIFIIEELKKLILKEKDRLAEMIFKNLIAEKKLLFFLITETGGFKIPPRLKVRSSRSLNRNDNSSIQRSLFDYVPEEEFNELEKSIAVYLDEQEKLLWWYRNISRQDYFIQGWKKNKIYPDFISTDRGAEDEDDFTAIYVLETKGVYLKNEDTKYKQDVFTLCNELGTKKAWKELDLDFPDKKFEFQIIYEDEWQEKINKIYATDAVKQR